MDAAAVIHTDPRDGADAFEPNYLAMVELSPPDLPWLFTPLGHRRQPAAPMDLLDRDREQRRH